MKLSIARLRELVEMPPKISAEEIVKKLTLHTAEIEEVINTNTKFKNIFAGRVESFEKVEKSNKLHCCQVFFGKKIGTRQIVCGFKPEQSKTYLVAFPGAILPNGMEIQCSKIFGLESNGMICANNELNMKNSEIMTVDDKFIGLEATEIFPECDDQIIDIDNKSLTHRPDLLGHRGFALELSAIFDCNLVNKKSENFAKKTDECHSDNTIKNLEIDIQTDKCRRFCGARLNNICVQSSAPNRIIFLENLDVKAISNIVDITNYIMLDCGQPMHAFDADKIEGKIIVRMAKNGEEIVALDEQTYELTDQDIVIADEKKVLSIAGIMGGLESSVTSETKNVVFESANFDYVSIRKTSQRLGLRSDSSMRFEKSLDTEQCTKALNFAITQTQNCCPNMEVVAFGDNYQTKPKQITISLSPEKVREISGIKISDTEISRNLEKLGFQVSKQKDEFIVTVPSFRATKDVSIAEDLIEEIVRLYGFVNIASDELVLSVIPPEVNDLRQIEWKIRDELVAQGLSEIYSTSFVAPDDYEFLETKKDTYVQTQNANNHEFQFLRQTLISNLLRNLETELRTHNELTFFEIGKTYKLPNSETQKLAILSAKINGNEENMFFDLKEKLARIFTTLGFDTQDFEIKPSDNPLAFVHPARSGDVFLQNENIGFLSAIHPTKNSVKNAKIVLAELNLESILQKYLTIQNTKKFANLSAFPLVKRDLSILVDKFALAGEIEKTIWNASPLLKKVELFDEFFDEKFGSERKNLAFHLEFQSPKKVLDEAEVDKYFQEILEKLNKNFGTQLRLDFEETKV